MDEYESRSKKELSEYNNLEIEMTFKELISEMNDTMYIRKLTLNDDWTFPVAKVVSKKTDEYWRFDAMPLKDKSGDIGYLYVYRKEMRKKDYNNLFNKRNAYSKMTTVWKDLYKISRYVSNTQGIYIGGDHKPNIPVRSLNTLRDRLVGNAEIQHYIDIQNGRVLEDFIDMDTSRAKALIARQQEKRHSEILIKNDQNRSVITQVNTQLKEFHDELKEVLDQNDKQPKAWIEHDYQKLLFKIFPFIFPQYTHFIREYNFKIDGNAQKKEDIPDFIALNSSLSVDVMEIKTPDFPLFRKGQYRKNFVFASEVQGLISQIQKYIYNLTRNSLREEPRLQKRFEDKAELKLSKSSGGIHIRSPKGLIVVGRSPSHSTQNLEEAQQQEQDFDIYKRRYEDILFFLTYDDILDWTERIISRQSKIE